MTTSTQQTVLTADKIACRRDVARGMPRPADDAVLGILAAGPSMVPGIDE